MELLNKTSEAARNDYELEICPHRNRARREHAVVNAEKLRALKRTGCDTTTQ